MPSPRTRSDLSFPRPRGRIRATREAGFSLLEVLVAFVVLAILGTALFRLFGGAMGNAGAAEAWSRANLIAQTRLAMAASADPLREGTDGGTEDDGRIRWESRVAPYDPPDATAEATQFSQALGVRLWRVAVTVHMEDGLGRDRAVTLETLRLGAKGAS